MRAGLLIALLMLAGCGQSKAAILEQQYSETVSDEEKCRLAGQLADTYLEAGDQKNYQHWDFMRRVGCT